jgi:ATP-dependent Lon protease
MVARICRKVATKVARGIVRPVTVGPRDLQDYLGAPRVADEGARRVRVPGVAQGLAWTPFGGDVLFIEAALSPGKGMVTLTGQLGEVMNESARIALHYVRSHAQRFGIKHALDDKHDLHIHFPAGAIPKDGPSAGVSIAAAVLSLLRRQRFPADLAMTGELTLVGEVLPVGGIREKVLAARRMGIKRVVLPAENRRDVVELKPHLRAGVKFVYAETFLDVFAEVFGRPGALVRTPRKGEAARRPTAAAPRGRGVRRSRVGASASRRA